MINMPRKIIIVDSRTLAFSQLQPQQVNYVPRAIIVTNNVINVEINRSGAVENSNNTNDASPPVEVNVSHMGNQSNEADPAITIPVCPNSNGKFEEEKIDRAPVSSKKLDILVDTLSKKLVVENNAAGRDGLVKIMETEVYKLKSAVLIHLHLTKGISSKLSPHIPGEFTSNQLNTEGSCLKRFGSALTPAENVTIHECRCMVKGLICSVKTISSAILKSEKAKSDGEQGLTLPAYLTRFETLVYCELLTQGLKALEIFAIVEPEAASDNTAAPKRNLRRSRSKEEVEAFQMFASIFHEMNPYTFRAIFTVSITACVEAIQENVTAQKLVESLLTHINTSSIFSMILIEYLMKKIEVIGKSLEQGDVHVKLFKLICESVSLLPVQNQPPLGHYLEDIIFKVLHCAEHAVQPLNYFMLLRFLFGVIGKEDHTHLGEVFLPLLRRVINGLSNLWSVLFQPELKFIVLELLLILPVRLNAMLPFLHLLKIPLISALKGPPVLIRGGLNVLEILVDKHFEILCDKFQAGIGELMETLWTILRKSQDGLENIAFRILGKFGGMNRKTIMEPRLLECNNNSGATQTLTITLMQHYDEGESIQFPVEKIVKVAVSSLCAGNSFAKERSPIELFYAHQAYKFLQGFIYASMSTKVDEDMPHKLLHMGLAHGQALFDKDANQGFRQVLVTALTGWIMGGNLLIKRKQVFLSLTHVSRYFALAMATQQVESPPKEMMVDPYVILDAVFNAMGHEKNFRKPALFVLAVIINTLVHAFQSKDKVLALPVISYILDKVCTMCYELEPTAKLGGCHLIRFLLASPTPTWFFTNLFPLFRATIYVLTASPQSCMQIATDNLSRIAHLVCTLDGSSIEEFKTASVNALVAECVPLLTSPSSTVREESNKMLHLIMELGNKSVVEMLRHQERKCRIFRLGKCLIRTQPVLYQLGVLEGCASATALGLVPFNETEHKNFIHDILALGDASDDALAKIPAYKHLTDYVPLKKAVMTALAGLPQFSGVRDHIVSIFSRQLNSPNVEIHMHAFACVKEIAKGNLALVIPIGLKAVPQFLETTNIQLWTISSLSQLACFYQLFPQYIPGKIWGELIVLLEQCLDSLVVNEVKQLDKFEVPELKLGEAIVECFHVLPGTMLMEFVVLLVSVCVSRQKLLEMITSTLEEPLMRVVLKLSVDDCIKLFLSPCHVENGEWRRFFLYVVQQEEGKKIREELMKNPDRVLKLLSIKQYPDVESVSDLGATSDAFNGKDQNIRFFVIKILNTFGDGWIAQNGRGQDQVLNALMQLWISSDYLAKFTTDTLIFESISKLEFDGKMFNGDSLCYNPPLPVTEGNVDKLETQRCRETILVANMLLSYFQKEPANVDLLFQLLTAFCDRPVLHFHFIRLFLTNVLTRYSVEWKQKVFVEFCRVLNAPWVSDEVKVKIVQFVLIPCFGYSFQNGETGELLRSVRSPFDNNFTTLLDILFNQLLPRTSHVTSDLQLISLAQFCCLIVDQAASHVFNNDNISSSKLLNLISFGWSTMLSKSSNPNVKLHGHLLLAYIVAKFTIPTNLMAPVFEVVWKASSSADSDQVKAAIKTANSLYRNSNVDGNTVLMTIWTGQHFLDKDCSRDELILLLKLVITHTNAYYHVKQALIPWLVVSVYNCCRSTSCNISFRTVVVDFIEVLIGWDLMQAERNLELNAEERWQMMGDQHVISVISILMKTACTVEELYPETPGGILSRKCLALLKRIWHPGLWLKHISSVNLDWLDKILMSCATSSVVDRVHISVALQLLTMVIGVVGKNVALEMVTRLEKGLAGCVSCPNHSVTVGICHFISQLLVLFPAIFPHGKTLKYPGVNLSVLCGTVNVFISGAIGTYGKEKKAPPQNLLPAWTMLKAICEKSPNYVDAYISPFVNCLVKLASEHISFCVRKSVVNPRATIVSNMLVTGLIVVKYRVGVMGSMVQEHFFTTLTHLTNRSTDVGVIEAILKMVSEWITNKNTILVNLGPTTQEKVNLLKRLLINIEARFGDCEHLFKIYFDVILFIYRDEQYIAGGMPTLLQREFLSGLRSTIPAVRMKFFEILDESMCCRMLDRLLFILCTQDWGQFGNHYWIKQCIELMFATVIESKITLGPTEAIVSGISLDPTYNVQGYQSGSNEDDTCRASFLENCVTDLAKIDENNESQVTLAVSRLQTSFIQNGWTEPPSYSTSYVKLMLNKQRKFVRKELDKIKTTTMVKAMVQLCHVDTKLAESVWTDFFPRAWEILCGVQQKALAEDIFDFLQSGTHLAQIHCTPSAINTFVKGVLRCVPEIKVDPSLMRYLGKRHGLWHLVCLHFEKQYFRQNESAQVLEILSELYSLLEETDLWAGLWQRTACKETSTAVTFEQLGQYDKAYGAYNEAMMRDQNAFGEFLTLEYVNEFKMLETHWLKCAKELNTWDGVDEYCRGSNVNYSHLVLDGEWRHGKWNEAKGTCSRVREMCPESFAWKLNLIQGYLAMYTNQNLDAVESHVNESQRLCIQEWRALPSHFSKSHVGVLQKAQQIMEFTEAASIHHSLLAYRSDPYDEVINAVTKWKNRPFTTFDGLSFWSDVLSWRVINYKFIFNDLSDCGLALSKNTTSNASLDSMPTRLDEPRATAHCRKMFRLFASNLRYRKYNKNLNPFLTMQVVPMSLYVPATYSQSQDGMNTLYRAYLVKEGYMERGSNDVYTMCRLYHREVGGQQKVYIVPNQTQCPTKEQTANNRRLLVNRQQVLRVVSEEVVKVTSELAKMARKHGLDEVMLDRLYTFNMKAPNAFSTVKQQVKACMHKSSNNGASLLKALELMESVDLKSYSNITMAEFFTLKGRLYQTIGNVNKAQKSLSAACQLHDSLAKCWGHFGEFSNQQFLSSSQMCHAVEAMTSYLHACRIQNEILARKYMAKILRLLMHDDENGTLLKSMEKYCQGVPPILWLPWINQLLSIPVKTDSPVLTNILFLISKSYPEAIYLAISTRYVKLKCEQVEKAKANPGSNSNLPSCQGASQGSQGTPHVVEATPKMWFYSKVIQNLRSVHPTVAISLNAIVTELNVPDSWHVKVYNKLKLLMRMCQDHAFESRTPVQTAKVNLMIETYVSNLVHLFGARSDFSCNEIQLSVITQWKYLFYEDFHTVKRSDGQMQLQFLSLVVQKWIDVLEKEIVKFQSQLLPPETSKFLLTFNQQTTDLVMPGEWLNPKHVQHYVKIASFDPKLDVIRKHQHVVKRLCIRGHNGKVYPYLMVNGVEERVEPVLQLMRFCNSYLEKQKSTAERGMRFAVPKYVPLTPCTRLVEDNQTSMTLLDIFKAYCANNGVDWDRSWHAYYAKLGSFQKRNKSNYTHNNLREIFSDIQCNYVPNTLLKECAMAAFATPTDYWMFRKNFTTQVCLNAFAEYAFCLSEVKPEMMNIQMNSGNVSVSYFKFDLDETSCGLSSNRAVPFRLTPNISALLTPHGVSGAMTAGLIALARCLKYSNYKMEDILRVVLNEEIMELFKIRQYQLCRQREEDIPDSVLCSNVIPLVNKATSEIMTRLRSLAYYDGSKSKASDLVSAAGTLDNLCRADPSGYPWL